MFEKFRNSVSDSVEWAAFALTDDPETERVFISPDRSREKREVHKRLVKDMRKKMSSDSSKYHDIYGTEVVSLERTPSSQTAPPVVEKEAVNFQSSSSLIGIIRSVVIPLKYCWSDINL